jgi:excisionase family DNA binding protein
MVQLEGSNPRSKSMEPTNDKLGYSPKKAAAYLGISRSKLYELIADSRLIARKLECRTIIHRDDLDAFLASLPPIPPNGRS